MLFDRILLSGNFDLGNSTPVFQNMSFLNESNRRDNNYNRSRNRANPVQTARREWVPRGAAPTGAVTTTEPTPVLPVDNVNDNRRNGDSSIGLLLPANNQHRAHQGFRGYRGQHSNQKRDQEKEKEKFQNKNAPKDMNIPLLVQEIQDKLTKNAVECMICYDMVRRSAPIWSCSGCFSIFHLTCIKKWARAPTSIDLLAEKSQGFNWRCPGCQAVQLTSSKEIRYRCFCEKRLDPPSDLYLTPHSCGEPCGKPLEKEVPDEGMKKDYLCPHSCVLQCHPGPCPPCRAFAPPQRCPCGKKVITTRCSDRKAVLTCGQLCDKPLNCGRHRCDRICHVGSCGPCQVLFNASCFCQRKIETVLCGDMVVKGQIKVEDGVFSCNSNCEKKLNCGNHVCPEVCHPGPCGECSLLPSKIKTCCCGKTSLKDNRKSCMDPIPTCSEMCEKILPCGVHRCKETCHSGICAPCLMLVTQKCRCGSTSRTVECHKTQSENENFTCDKPCGKKKTCGRHRCSERCCPVSSSNNSSASDSDPHLCRMPCGKKLRCGQHSCPLLCHSGHCPPCLETIFTDLTCACGRTSIPPPLPCGTPYPSCQHPCSVPQPCGHASTHSCHFGDCPPCTVPVAKDCTGGHVVLRNIPCGSKDVRCNKLCGKTRQCGLHACARTCHCPPCDNSSGPSTGLRASCGQTCGAPRRDCRHTCTALCHPSTPCPDLRCEFPVTISCSCGRITVNVPCDAGGSNGGYTADTVLEASILHKLPAPLQPIEGNVRVPLGQRKLMCDDECSKMERKKLLADAFGVTTPNIEALHFGETAVISEVLSDLMRRDPKWVLAVEERCKYLVLGRARGRINALKVHVFCPMSKEKRDAVRLIAERWKLSVNAAGWEPKRFVVIHVTPKSKAPARILGVKDSAGGNMLQPSVFDALVDMDPRLVVALFDLPRDADVSALVLRFGGECELVWLNDKNALAIFSDPARAATAMRRLDQGSIYYGAAAVPHNGVGSAASGQNVWGTVGGTKYGNAVEAVKSNPWKKAVMQEPDSRGSPWDAEDWSHNSGDAPSVWKANVAPIAATNRWSPLESEAASSSSSSSHKATSPKENLKNKAPLGSLSEAETKNPLSDDVVDDWEKAYE